MVGATRTGLLTLRRALPVLSVPAFLAVFRLCSSVFRIPFSITAFVRQAEPSPSKGDEAVPPGSRGSSIRVMHSAAICSPSRPSSRDIFFWAFSAEKIPLKVLRRDRMASLRITAR